MLMLLPAASRRKAIPTRCTAKVAVAFKCASALIRSCELEPLPLLVLVLPPVLFVACFAILSAFFTSPCRLRRLSTFSGSHPKGMHCVKLMLAQNLTKESNRSHFSVKSYLSTKEYIEPALFLRSARCCDLQSTSLPRSIVHKQGIPRKKRKDRTL